VRNTFIIFVLSGFWHGANWTFIVWGLINAIYFIPILLLKRNRLNIEIVAKGKMLPTLKELVQILITFIMTLLAWIFFRSVSIQDAICYISIIFSRSLLTLPELLPLKVFILVFLLVITEWLQRERQHALFFLQHKPIIYRWSVYILIAVLIMFFGAKQESFIYFQF
jgi:hypothetical protein